MVTKTFYMTNSLLSTIYQEISETSPGADAYASPATGWVVSTTAASNYSAFRAGVERAATTFNSTVIPTANSLDTTNGDALRTTSPLDGQFASANWTLNFVVRAQTNASGQDGRVRIRMYRSQNADGTNFTEITSAVQIGATLTNIDTASDWNSSITFNPGAIDLSNEYLFIQIAWEIIGAATMTTADVNFRIGTNSTRIVSADFTPQITKNVNEIEQSSEAKNYVLSSSPPNPSANTLKKNSHLLMARLLGITAITKVVNETEQSSETINKVLGFIKVVNESEESAEALNKILGLTKVINETEQSAESTVRVLGISRVVNETEQSSEQTNKLVQLGEPPVPGSKKSRTWRTTPEPVHTFWAVDIRRQLVAHDDLRLPVNLTISKLTSMAVEAYAKTKARTELKLKRPIPSHLKIKARASNAYYNFLKEAEKQVKIPYKLSVSLTEKFDILAKAESVQLNRVEESLRSYINAWIVRKLVPEATVPMRAIDSIAHDRTKTSRTVRAIEDKLAIDLARLARRIIAEEGDVSIASFPGTVMVKYDQELRRIIGAAVQQSYQAGIDYASDFFKLPPAVTKQDRDAMDKEIERRVQEFWGTIMRIVGRKDMEPHKRPFDLGAAMAASATVLAWSVLALATWNKTRELSPDTQVIWITALDDRVCPICRPLHGRVWSVSDPDLIVPVDDTHPNCRCRLLIRDRGDIFSH